MTSSGPTVERILVVTAHPDDVDFASSASIAAWTAAGIEVAYCIASYGDAGGFDETPRDEIPALREREQRAAAAVVGVSDLTFLGYPDGRIYLTHELRRDIARQIRRVRPNRIVCHSPERNWQRIAPSHPDHMAVGEATLCAVYPDARNPFAHPELLAEEGLEAWTVPEVWVMGGPQPTHFEDVTDTFDKKVAALSEHVSQVGQFDDLAGFLRTWHAANAMTGGLPPGRLAEAYQVVNTA